MMHFIPPKPFLHTNITRLMVYILRVLTSSHARWPLLCIRKTKSFKSFQHSCLWECASLSSNSKRELVLIEEEDVGHWVMLAETMSQEGKPAIVMNDIRAEIEERAWDGGDTGPGRGFQ